MRKRWLSLSVALVLPWLVPGEVWAQAAGTSPTGGGAPPPADAPAGAESPPEPPPDRGEGEEGADLSQPPPQGKGAIWGVVRDTTMKEPLPEVQVTVVQTGQKIVADYDGRYRLELPPGTYTLRFYYELHQPTRLDNVVVATGEVKRVDAELTPEEDAEVVEVEMTLDRSTVSSQILRRQRSAAAGDAVGRAEIAKTPDSNAAQAAQRVVGATVVGNRFVYVRGLGERYTNSLLNGAPLPSPEPDRAAVPLDVFPSLVLDNITIAKTFTPDVPGDFAGGSVRVETREIPTEPLFQVSLGLGFNTQATFQDRLDHRGGDLDFLGFDDGTREQPELPEWRLRRTSRKPDGELPSNEELTGYGRALNSYMSAIESGTVPNHSFSLAAGQGFDLGGERRLGYLAALSYSHTYSAIRNAVLRQFAADSSDPNGIATELDYRADRGSERIRWSAFGSVTYQFDKNNRVHLTGIRNQLADDDTTEIRGFRLDAEAPVRATRLSFVSRALNFGQLRGEHTVPALNRAQIDWNLFLSSAERDEPDTRDTVYELVGGDRHIFQFGSDSGRHFFSSQDEQAYGGGLDFTQPVVDSAKLKFGGLLSLKDRSFVARRFAYEENSFYYRVNDIDTSDRSVFTCPGAGWQRSCPDNLFVGDNIGSGRDFPAPVQVVEGTLPGDWYDATLNVYAAYLMADVELAKDLRLIVGERLEVTDQSVAPSDIFGEEVNIEAAQIDEVDLLPSVNLVFNATENSKLRGSVSRTLARPQLRELAPFAFADYFGGRLVVGNPRLELTHITNMDLRFEHFPSLQEVLAFSLFYKSFEKPIEQVIIPGAEGGTVSYRNSPGGKLIGVELEARKDLAFLSERLEDFSVVSNLTLARSRIQVEQTGFETMTNLSRPMVNQAPWVVNLALDYSNEDVGFSGRVLYNVSGPQVVQVGLLGLDDAYLQPRHVVDLALSQRLGKNVALKLAVNDLFNSTYLVTQGDQDEGFNVVERWTSGAVYTVTGTYTF